MADAPPPPPPPHGQNPRPPPGAGVMPDGNYDIFIIPPHSAGAGFLYLPSLQPHRNSFLAGVASALIAVALYVHVLPILKHWVAAIMAGGGGIGVLLLAATIGATGWAVGKFQHRDDPKPESGGSKPGGSRPNEHTYAQPPPHSAPPPQQSQDPPPQYSAPPPRPDQYSAPQPDQYSTPPPPRPEPRSPPKPSGAASGWEKAREATRRREEERKRAEDLQKKREEIQKAREDAERAAKAKAEKEKWEQARAREKEQREREARERIARERLARETEAREKEAKERAAREEAEKEKLERERAEKAEKERREKERLEKERAAASARSTPSKPATSRYEKPTARSFTGTEEEHSFRPYDRRPAYKTSASSIVSGLSASSYAASHSTARTSPPPSMRGPYSTKDPNKIQIKAVYLFSDAFPMKPISSLVAGVRPVTDGLVLRIETEGLFIDDDVRRVPQREWDVKAWTLKLVEDGLCRSAPGSSASSLHVVRACARDADNKKYTFILEESEAWKVAIGLQRLRKGSQVRSLAMNGMKDAEARMIVTSLGFT